MKMMKFFLFAAAAVAAISCAKELSPIENANPTPEVERIPMTFTASYAETTETKVALDENGATVWQLGDKIMVISANGDANEFEAIEVTNGGKSATFEGLIEKANEYYAVYPASAYKGTPEYVTEMQDGKPNGKLVVEVPNVQQAVAGTFHPSAILCIANTKGTNFTFKHSCAFLKFNLANPEGVKSVRLSVNDSDNVAGIGYVGVNDTDINTKYPTSDKNMSKYDMITLNAPEGGFVAGENYYIAMRANSCKEGITAYIEYEDKVMSRTNNKKVFAEYDEDGNEIASGSIGRIKNLGQLDKNLNEVTPYDAYNLGADLVVAGKSYSPADLGSATLVSEEGTTISANGVYFVNEGVEVTLAPASGHYLSLYIVSNNLNGRAKLNVSDNIRWTKNGVICLKGMDMIDGSANKTLFQSNALDGTVVIDDCSIPTPKNTQLIYAGHAINEITICNSDIKIETAGKYLINGNSQTIANCQIENNIIYSPGEDVATFKFITNTPTINTLSFNKNTVANVFSSTTANEDYFKVNSIETFNCFNNLFYLPNYSDGRYLYITKVIPTSLNQADNFLHKTASTNSRMRVIYEGDPKVADVWVITKKIASDVVTSVDLAHGIIVPATTAGATR